MRVWQTGVDYIVGDEVAYPDATGDVYVCQQAHTSLTGWEPPAVPALWTQKERNQSIQPLIRAAFAIQISGGFGNEELFD